MGRSAPVRSAPGFRSRPPLPSRPVSPGRDCRFFLRLRHDSVRCFANLPNGGARSLQSVCFACLLCLSASSLCLFCLLCLLCPVLSCSVLLCPLVHPPVCPFVRLFRLLSICSICSVRSSARPPVRPSAHSPCPRLFRPSRLLCLSVCQLCLIPVYPFIHSARPSARPRPVPSASSLRLSALSDSRLFLYPLRSSRPPALTFLSAPPALLPARASSLRSFVSVRSACPVRLLRPSRSGAAEFYSADFAQCFVFSSQDVFSHPISDTLLKSRRGELGISDNN